MLIEKVCALGDLVCYIWNQAEIWKSFAWNQTICVMYVSKLWFILVILVDYGILSTAYNWQSVTHHAFYKSVPTNRIIILGEARGFDL